MRMEVIRLRLWHGAVVEKLDDMQTLVSLTAGGVCSL